MYINKFRLKSARKNKSAKRQPRYWVLSATALGLMVAFTAGSSRAMNIGFVKNGSTEITRNASSGKDAPLTKFDIPAGSLSDVLAAFEKQTGWRVEIPDNVRTVGSPGVSGNFTNEEALKQILQNTGVAYSVIAPNVVSLKLQAESATVEVVDENTPAVSSPKYTEPLRDTPQTITVIDKEIIKEQGATTLRDVLRNVPGLTVTAVEGGNVGGDNLTLRGFSARNDIYVDGARDLSPQNRDPFNLEQVEVVKGPSSATTGRGSTGGTVNLVTKSPNLLPSYSLDLTGGTDKTKRVTGDINVPLERFHLGERNAFRVSFVGHDSAYAGRDDVKNSRYGVAPTLLLGLTRKTTLTLGYFFLGQKNVQDYGIPFVTATNNVLAAYRDRPAPVSRENFYGYRDLNKEYLKSHLGTITLNHIFNDKMSLRNQFRYDHSSRDSIASPGRFFNDNTLGINREIKAWLTTDQNYDNQTDFTARFKTGFIEHALVTGTELIHENSRRYTRSAQTAANSTDLYNPNPDDVYPYPVFTNPLPGIIKSDTAAFYIFDTLKLHPKFELSGGFRYENFETIGDLPPTITLTTPTVAVFGTTRAHVSKTDNLLNARLAAIYKPVENGSFYFSYGTSSNPSLSGLLYENATTTNLDPEKTTNYEVGGKWDFFENRLLFSGALFRVLKTNARTPDPVNNTLQILDGKQRVDGIELSVTGKINDRWSVLSGYTLLASKIIESNVFSVVNGSNFYYEIGNRFINTPRNSFNLWSTYRLPLNINIGGGGRFVDRRYANTLNTRFVDGYWSYDATASYQINKHFDIRLNGYNLTNKYYFDRISGGHTVPGPGRSLLVSTGIRF